MLSDVFGQHLHHNSLSEGYRRSHTRSIPSLAGISMMLLSLVCASSGFAQDGKLVIESPKMLSSIVLPTLGNTPETDRPLLREISDVHVYDPSASASNTNTADANKTLTSSADPATQQNAEFPEAAATQNLWEFVKQSRRLDIPDNERIASYQEQYRSEAFWISKVLNRATPFAGHIVEALDQRYLPVELALLPAIESGFQPDVHSAEYAAGIWQIVPATAAEIGIERSTWFDGRADIIESTVAAIDYLSYLNAEFHGDWLLTLAAYNAGPGRVRGAIRRNIAADLPTDFWSLNLPRETQNYVPKFLALVDMLRQGDAPELEIPEIPRGRGFDVVELQRRVSIDKLAPLTGMSEAALRNLNAALVHGVTPPAGPHRIYVDRGQGRVINQKLADSDLLKQLFTLPATHQVVSGDTVSTIALRYGLSERQLLTMNALDDTRILIGQELAVRTYNGPANGNIEYVVTIGDTLSDIAQRFSVQMGNIRDAEGQQLASDLIHPGIRLSIAIEDERPG